MLPVIDLHCDLLAYLAKDESGDPNNTDAIGCAIPHLKAGGVKLQVCALFSTTREGSTEFGWKQAEIYRDLLDREVVKAWQPGQDWEEALADDAVYVLPSIESGSVFAEENESIEQALYRFEIICAKVGKPLYLTMTHHTANRFGGGNNTELGLQPDGAALLEYLDKRNIAIDLSHTSNLLAHELFKYIAGRKLEIPLIASHSNFREIVGHVRNLPDSYAEYLFKKDGIMGINFVRDFVGPDDHNMLIEHFRYGHQMGARMAFGMDYFPPGLMPPEMDYRLPFFHPEHANAGLVPGILKQLSEFMNEEELAALAHGNALAFLRRLGF